MEVKTYSNPLLPTSQFVMCGNCFRADMYHSCAFGCEYCFANNRGGNFKRDFQVANVDLIRKWFQQAIENQDTSNIKKEFLHHRVPIHLGGLTDPFQESEKKYRATYRFLEITNFYHYPVNISTKTSELEDMYWEILDPTIHTFSLSIMGYTDKYIRLWERNTPTAIQRIEFAKELKKRGFWVSIRIQPIVDIEEVLLLIEHTRDFVDFYTVEHLKIPVDNSRVCKELIGKCQGINASLVPRGREYEFDTNTKIANIRRIKEATTVKIGVGDNELHEMSDCLNCCGIDLMPKAFSNWLKYNSMYIRMTGDWTQWTPKSNANCCLNGDYARKGGTTMKQFVDDYYRRVYGDPTQLYFNF